MLWVLRFDHVYDLDNIRMLEFSKQVNLSEDSLAVNFVLKNSVHLLDCHFFASGFVQCTAYHPVRALSELLDAFVVCTDLPVSKGPCLLLHVETLSLLVYFSSNVNNLHLMCFSCFKLTYN